MRSIFVLTLTQRFTCDSEIQVLLLKWSYGYGVGRSESLAKRSRLFGLSPLVFVINNRGPWWNRFFLVWPGDCFSLWPCLVCCLWLLTKAGFLNRLVCFLWSRYIYIYTYIMNSTPHFLVVISEPVSRWIGLRWSLVCMQIGLFLTMPIGYYATFFFFFLVSAVERERG